MWTAVALTTVMTLAPAQTLELKNVRTTYGLMGETRKNDKFLPGDVLFVAFDIAGLEVKPNGGVQYSIGRELTMKGKKKPEFKEELRDYDAELNLGGTTLPASVYYPITPDAVSGEYTLKVTVKDRQTKKEKVLEKTFEVLSTKLGLVQVFLTSSRGDPVPPVAVPGQRIYVHYTLVGFKLSKEKQQPHVTFEMIVQDDAGKPTVKKAYKGDIKMAQKDTPGMMEFLPRQLDLNKPGKYKIVLKATDNLSKETVEQTMNLTVLDTAN
jgi:hypothetical protein